MHNHSSTIILKFIENEPRISHRVMAKNTDNLEVSVQNLINKHMAKLELFGSVHFENEPREDGNSGGDQPKTYYLNEPQATLLLTFMRNNEIVIEFKIRLVKEFYRMREDLKSKQQTQEISHQAFDLDFYTQENEKMVKLIELLKSQDIKTLYYLDNLSKNLNIKSPLELLKIDLKNYYLIPTELGKVINVTAIETNKILEARGFQVRENNIWHLTEKGKSFGIEFQNGNFLQIKWKLESII